MPPTPFLERLRQLGDEGTVAILEVILREEVAYVVAAGTRWHPHYCERDGIEVVETFFGLIRDYMGVDLRGPFNRRARMEAGFSEEEFDRLAALAPTG